MQARAHGEGGAVVTLLTENNGKHAGFVHGAHSSRKRGVTAPGALVGVQWQARTSDNLGTFTLEEERGLSPLIMADPLKLGALLSACSLCEAALPEREGHPGLFYGLHALMDILQGEVWGAAYVLWEIALLKELGFGIDLTRCAGGGDPQTLAYVSPKSGRAVSYAAGEPYKDKLLPLPGFLKPNGGAVDEEAVALGLTMTGHFMEHWVFAHHTKGVPEARIRFQSRFEKSLAAEGAEEKRVHGVI